MRNGSGHSEFRCNMSEKLSESQVKGSSCPKTRRAVETEATVLISSGAAGGEM
jgi:hypothetical protein